MSSKAATMFPAMADVEGQPRPLVDQVADRHAEIESLIKVAGKAWKDATQPDRTHEWRLSVLLVAALLLIVGLTATLAAAGRFEPSVAFVMGTALGAVAATLKDFLLPARE